MRKLYTMVGALAAVLTILTSLNSMGVTHIGFGSTTPLEFPGTSAPSLPPGQDTQEAPAEITLSSGTVPRGGKLTVHGSGFKPGETVEIRVHVTSVGAVTADSTGRFTQTVTVPQDAPPPGFSTSVSATGHSSVKTATAPFATG